MRIWQLDRSPGRLPLPADAVALLLDASADRRPAAAMLAFLDAIVPVDYLSLVEYRPSRLEGMQTPELVEGLARPGTANLTPDCFAQYRQRYWRDDRATRIAQGVAADASGGIAAMHVHAADIPLAAWRREIYDRAQLADRMSFHYSVPGARTFAINLYRDRGRGGFGADEIDRLLAVAPLLGRAHRAALRAGASADDDVAADVGAGADGTTRAEPSRRLAVARTSISRAVPELSPRELEVCARIACGMPLDGIATELDVAPSTVATLRKRGYGKLAARGVLGGRMRLAAFARIR